MAQNDKQEDKGMFQGHQQVGSRKDGMGAAGTEDEVLACSHMVLVALVGDRIAIAADSVEWSLLAAQSWTHLDYCWQN